MLYQTKNEVLIIFGAMIIALFLLAPHHALSVFPQNTQPAVAVTTPSGVTEFFNLLPAGSSYKTLLTRTFGVQIGEECGGGTTQVTGIGPEVKEVTSCAACKEIATCVGNKVGVNDPGYLWDSVTKICGVGVVASQSIIDSCKGVADTCLGVDKARFDTIKSDALAAVAAGPAFYSPEFLPDAETLLALTWIESKWNNFAGAGTYPTDICAVDKTPFEDLCADSFRDEETKFMDVNGDGTPDGKACLEMPISQDPDGAGLQCGGKMGIGQISPSTYITRIQTSSFASAGELHPNPWDVRDGFFAAEELLAFNRKRIYDSCFTTCLGAGNSPSACQTNCTGTMDKCGIIDYHFGEGSCAITAEQQAFLDEVNKIKPVMKSLLDTGSCPAGPGPGPGGPLPSPCPLESSGAANLTNYISSTYNIHFDGPWTAGGLYDMCQKLYETSGTRFDDFFVNDPDGATVATDGGGGFCSVSMKKVSCDPNMPLIGSRGEIFTLVLFHELGHTLKSLNAAAAREDDIGPVARFEYSLHLGETTTPWLFDSTRHISKYPYGLHAGTCPIASSWPTEEYAETVSHYFHPGTGEIMLPAGACMGGSSFKPYVNANHKAPEHCNLMYDVMGAYNPACAETLGIWQIHSNICDATDAGSCQARLTLQFFDTHAADAVQICRRESGGNALILNDGCLTGETFDYSVGLFQINLLAHCKDEDGDGVKPFSLNNPFCAITDQDDVNICMKKFGYGDPITNTAKALEIAQAWGGFGSGGTGWDPWSTADACGLMPHP